MEKLKRTHYCGVLRESNLGERVVLMGWVQRRRDLGGVIFIDLRDRHGVCQVIFDASNLSAEDFARAEHLRSEYVIAAVGVVEKRSEDTINPNLETGTIDVRATALHIYSESKTPPFPIDEASSVREEIKLKHRYLDIRRPELLNNLIVRQRVLQYLRSQLIEGGFLEVETPILTKSTPEGARDYLVPSRLKKGNFYALPQSPQIYKQLLMVGGIDRYFQVAKCFRDEDLRADRQPEFTQFDMELSFVDEEDVLALLETLMSGLFESVLGVEIPKPFKRITYQEAMDSYGSDKPDLRFGMPMIDLTEMMRGCGFSVFNKAVAEGGVVKAICIPGGDALTRTQIEYLTKRAVEHGGSGMAWIAFDLDGTPKSILTKYFSMAEIEKIMLATDANPGDLIVFCAEPMDRARFVFGNLRLDIGDMLGLRKKDDYAFLIVTEFPLLEYSPEEKRFMAMHHPFTMPKEEDIHLFETDPGSMRAKAYDVVLNGIELGSGSIRIHDRDIQSKMFKALGFSAEEIEKRFGFMLGAFEYGVPPHGGFAFGIDRLLMLMIGADSIREVIAFPKMRDGSCAMMDTPSTVDYEQLEVLGISFEGHSETASVGKKAALDRIDHVAELARIALKPDERQDFARDLSDIIAFADQIAALDLEAVEPLNHVTDDENVFRADVVAEAYESEALLKNAPARVDDYFFVPKTVE